MTTVNGRPKHVERDTFDPAHDGREDMRDTGPSAMRDPGTQLRGALIDAAVVTLACLIFLGLCLFQVDLPGLYADEAFDVIPAMQLLLGHPVELQRGIGLHLFGLDLPLMSSSDYQGVTSTYLVLPFFAALGINVAALRMMTITVGVLGVILSFFLARSWFGSTTARFAVLLMALSPAWVFWSRLGVYVVSQVMPIAAGSLLAFTAWVRGRPFARGHNGKLYLGAFLLGLGLTTKLLFLWFILAVVVTALILWGRPLWETRREWLRDRGRWLRVGLGGFAAFCLGAAPFIIYNILSGGTFSLLRATVSAPGTTHGVSNAAVLRNLWTKADDFRVLLDGGYFWFQGVAGQIHTNPLSPAVFAISALGLIVFVLLDHTRGGVKLGRALRPGAVLLIAGLGIALLLSTGIAGGTPASLGVLFVALLGLAGVVLTLRAALREPDNWTAAAWLLFGVTAVAGVVWWFAGTGRPPGLAPNALLGLWPVDGAGVLFWLGGAGTMILLGIDRTPAAYQRVTTACLAIIGLVLAQSAVTVSGLWSTHLIMLLPLPQVVIAAFALRLGGRLARLGRRVSGVRGTLVKDALLVAPALLIVGVVAFYDLRAAYAYHRDMAQTGGISTFSDSIYSLAGYLDREAAGRKVVALDWGIKRPVQFLTLDRINPDDAYGYEQTPSQATIDGIRARVAQPNTLFLFRSPEAGVAYPRFEIFAEAARAIGKQPVLERTFYTRDGGRVYEVYSVR